MNPELGLRSDEGIILRTEIRRRNNNFTTTVTVVLQSLKTSSVHVKPVHTTPSSSSVQVHCCVLIQMMIVDYEVYFTELNLTEQILDEQQENKARQKKKILVQQNVFSECGVVLLNKETYCSLLHSLITFVSTPLSSHVSDTTFRFLVSLSMFRVREDIPPVFKTITFSVLPVLCPYCG